MKKPTRRRLILIAVAIAVALAVVYAFTPKAIPVDSAAVARAPLQVVVEEEGETRIEDRYVITAPVAAYLRRIELEEGDIVQQGQTVVRLAPPRAAILDPRTQAQAEARVRAATAAVRDAEVVAERSAADHTRVESLYRAGAVAQQELEQARAAAVRATAGLEAARAELASRGPWRARVCRVRPRFRRCCAHRPPAACSPCIGAARGTSIPASRCSRWVTRGVSRSAPTCSRRMPFASDPRAA